MRVQPIEITPHHSAFPPQWREEIEISGWTLSKLSVCLTLTIWVLILPILSASASDKPFNAPSNWGGSGLFEIPNARVLDDGDMRFGYAYADPYSQLVLSLGVLPRIEFNLRYTEIDDIPSGLGSDFGDYKDKAFDVKLQLVKESKQFPAVAIGLQDFYGTELFRAQYLTISRQIFPLDFTLGFGRERLKGSAELPFWDEVGIFGGIEWAINDRISAALEYSPVEYEKDPLVVRTTDESADSPWNIGLKFKVTSGFSLGLSYQRGDTLGLMGHITFSMGKPILPKRPDPPNWKFLIHDPQWHPSDEQVVQGAVQEIHSTNHFSNISVIKLDRTIICSIQNDHYLSNTKAVGRVMRILLRYASPDIGKLTVNLSRRGIDVLSVSVAPQHLHDYLTGNLSQSLFKELIHVTASGPLPQKQSRKAEASEAKTWLTDYGVKPTIETFFNDPSGALKSRWSLDPYVTLQAWKGNAFVARLSYPIASDISSENVPPEDAVRSDVWKYSGSSTNLDQLLVDQVFKMTNRTYLRLSTGYLERMYAGAGGEVLAFSGTGRFAFGFSGDHVRKREPETFFELQDFESYTLLGNLYYHYSPLRLTLQAQAGRFLAGDEGLRFVFSRQYDTGAQVGFWYSLTDTSEFTGFNEDYHDKGFYIKIPVEMFVDRPTRKMLDYRMSPWTRDVGATVYHWQSLFNFGADLTPARFFDDFNLFSE